MPIEIKELHIRIAVDAAPAGQQPAAPTQGAAAPAPGTERDALIAECVDQVMQILQTKGER
jgi:hypothetical protein